MGWGTRLAIVAVAIVAVVFAGVAAAGHVVGIVASWQLTPVTNPVKWVAGSNAGSSDVGGTTTSVTISPNGTSATISATITYGENQYIDLIRINVSDAPYNVYIYLDPTSSALDPTYIDLAKSEIRIYDPNGDLLASTTLDQVLASQGLWNVGALSLNGQYRVDLVLTMKDGVPLPTNPLELDMKLYYSKTSETPLTG